MSRQSHQWAVDHVAHIVFNLCDYCHDDYLADHVVAQLMEHIIHMLSTEHGCPVYAYCVMPNHVHVVFKFTKSPTTILHFLKGSSANRINKLLGRTGQLWQHSTHDEIIHDREQFLNACFYVWLNPVKAGLVNAPEEYGYSDYKMRHQNVNDIAEGLFEA